MTMPMAYSLGGTMLPNVSFLYLVSFITNNTSRHIRSVSIHSLLTDVMAGKSPKPQERRRQNHLAMVTMMSTHICLRPPETDTECVNLKTYSIGGLKTHGKKSRVLISLYVCTKTLQDLLLSYRLLIRSCLLSLGFRVGVVTP